MTDETGSQSSIYDDPEFKCYREDLAAAKTLRLEVFKIFASHSLAISGGLIAAIGYLIKEFSSLAHVWLLLLAALVATGSLVAALFELIFSQMATVHLEGKLSKAYKNKPHEDDSAKLNLYSGRCKTILFSIPWLMFVSVLITGVFLALNIPNLKKGEAPMSNDKKQVDLNISCFVTDSSESPNPKQPTSKHILHIVTDKKGEAPMSKDKKQVDFNISGFVTDSLESPNPKQPTSKHILHIVTDSGEKPNPQPTTPNPAPADSTDKKK